MKRLFAVILTIVMALMTGCGAKLDARDYAFDECVSYYKVRVPNPDYTLCERADEETDSLFEAICEVEKGILNDAYKLNLQTEPIEIYFTDNIPKTVYGICDNSYVNGYYSFELNQVFLDSKLKVDKTKMMGIMAHEAIHYIYANNNDVDSKFFTYKNDTGELGDAMIEGLTQGIALDILVVLEGRGLCVGAYDTVKKCYYTNTIVTDILRRYSIPNIDMYYLTNNFELARKEFNEKVGDISSSHEPFELLEDALEKVQKYETEGNVELGTKYLEEAFVLIAYSVSNSDEEVQEAFLTEFDGYKNFSDDYVRCIHDIVGTH